MTKRKVVQQQRHTENTTQMFSFSKMYPQFLQMLGCKWWWGGSRNIATPKVQSAFLAFIM